MRKIKINNIEVDAIDSWDDLSIDNYTKLVELYSKSQDMVEELFMVEFIALLTGLEKEYIMGLYEEDLLVFTELIENFKIDQFKSKECREFYFNDRLYSYNKVNRLNMGEQISIKLLNKNSKTEYESWLNILAVMIRPATEELDEFNDRCYKVSPFDGDVDIINRRKEFIKNIKASEAMFILESFMGGRG